MRRARILLVDDNRVNRKLMAAVLEADGYRVDEAGSGREAVEGVRLLPYDLVLMDIQMADMDGVTATAAIRALGGRQGQVPIVAVSGDVDDEVIERCRAAGMNAHLAKPIAPDTLQQAVKQWTAPKAEDGAGAVPASPQLGGLAGHLKGAALAPVIDDFIGGATLRMAEIEREAAAGGTGRVRAVAHDLSGTSANLGLTELSQIARSLEIASTASDAAEVRRLIPETRAALHQAFIVLAEQRRLALAAGGAA